MTVISRKAYRFNRPGTKAGDLIAALTTEQTKKLSADERPYCDVRGGSVPGVWGEPTRLPDWAAEDPWFKAAFANGNLLIVPESQLNPEKVVKESQDKAAIASTLAAAAASLNPPELAGVGAIVDKDNLAEEETAEEPVPVVAAVRGGGRKKAS